MTKKTAKKKNLIFVIVAVVALVVAGGIGLLLLFFWSPNVKGSPQTIQVQVVDGQPTVVVQHGGDYGYDFKLEQQLNGGFVTVCVVHSNINTLKIEPSLDVHLGETYRFSARWTYKNKVGAFGTTTLWQPEKNLAQVDTDGVHFDENSNTLTWQAVPQADFYNILALSLQNGQRRTISNVEQTSCNLATLGRGEYQIFVQACSHNEKILPSVVEFGKVEIVQKNQILSANLLGSGAIAVVCTQDASEFEIFADGTSCGKVVGNATKLGGGNWQIMLLDAKLALAGVNTKTAKIEICSYAQPYMPQSEKVVVTKN